MNDASKYASRVAAVLNDLTIELPSWGFADTGTRFGKFGQDSAAIDFTDKLSDASHVNRLTGCCPKLAVHVLWDFSANQQPAEVKSQAEQHGLRIGSINPNLFQDQQYKYGSLCHPDAKIREHAVQHCIDSIKLGQAVDSRVVTLWLADGSNYPGQDNLRARKGRLRECLQTLHGHLSSEQSFLLEYKPFEPAFYHTDLADWGMSLALARAMGPQAKVLVDTGHHYQSQNIEQIVAWLLDEGMLGGFHFNDRRYADDDLTLASIDPYQIFRIFYEILSYAHDTGRTPTIEYMIDQSHNLKPKIEAMIQTVMTAQELVAKAAIVDFDLLADLQARQDIVGCERHLKQAFFTDVSGLITAWRVEQGISPDPLTAHRESGYLEAIEKERRQRRQELGIVTGGSYA
ncbi:MAG: sugar isomerase [Planctomycetaceae bacterium]|nr:sugar isomerase [Planctomycetaceae bacterium]